MKILTVLCLLAIAIHSVLGGQVLKVWKTPELPAVLATSLTTATLLYPLDLLRALSMQNPGISPLSLVKNFRADFGLKGFVSQGLTSEVGRATTMRTVKFGLFPKVHRRLYGGPPSEGTSRTRLVSAAITSVPEVALIMPLEASKVLLTMDSAGEFKNSMLRAVSSTPIGSLYTGWVGVQLRQMSWGCVYFSTIGPYKKLVEGWGTPGAQNVVAGFLAGSSGALLNTPCDTVRSVVMKKCLTQNTPASFLPTLRTIIRSKGVKALWAGYPAKAAHLGLGGAMMAGLQPVFSRACDTVASAVDTRRKED